ncbi:MAG: glycosyltransferase family 4 protein [Candidatus Marinimicrobia bacterium]|nr:glycosyltransferase family 4 protein [Candidatus Neomarinimicrobiota bacterium]MBT7115078.1 glycosyltransferase family 4 protein [Candidatus Neomarinimicrobiota bacterium]MBT7974870.1 glycosyltransferase family 4 protein [Candidatus Neomarinimicrobiota bacterium]|tara:strand:- start:241 stop:1431 length:1191 start_codon:yes stop_codon:yes gene_type:complete
MNILYLHQYFNTPSMPGSTRSYEFAKRLVARGDTVHMVTTNWQGKSKLSFTNESGINVYWAPIPYANKMNFLRRIWAYLGYVWFTFIIGHKLNYDLIIASSTPLTIAIPALWLKRAKRAKMIFEVRDLWPQLPIAIGALKSPIMIKIAQFLEKKAYAGSEKVIALSIGMNSVLKERVPSNKISVVTNLSDRKNFKVSDQKGINFRKNYPGISNHPLIVYTGVFGRVNGVIYLVEIAKEIQKINPNVRFLLTGDGFEGEKIKKQSIKYNLLNKILFMERYLPKNEMPDLLSAATITTSFFIDLPEMGHNSANKFFDGLAAGKPIMINYGGWQADLLKESGAGFIIPQNNSSQAAKILNDVLTNDETLNQMKKASRQLSHQFDVNTNFQKFETVIDSA